MLLPIESLIWPSGSGSTSATLTVPYNFALFCSEYMLVLSAESRERTRPLSHPEVQGTLTRYRIYSSCLSCPLSVLYHFNFLHTVVLYLYLPEVQGTLTRYQILSSCLSCPLPVLYHYSLLHSLGSVTAGSPGNPHQVPDPQQLPLLSATCAVPFQFAS